MRPIIYDSTETEFDTNGIGVLSDASSCVAKAALNGQYELTLKYPVTGIHFADIAQRSMILAKSDPDSELQPFRAYRITKPSASGIVTAYARHCAYDLMGIPAAPFTASSVSHALVQMKNNAVTDCPFTFFTDKSTAAKMTVSVPTPIWTLLGSSNGSILDTYGGEYEFDRWQVKLLNRRGADRGVTIRYGKNLTTLEQDENCANCYTGVYPYWTNTDGTELVQLPEKTLNAPGTYNYVRILTLDLSEEWDAAPTEEQLRARAQSYMTANDIGVPTVSWKIEFVQLEQTEEYKELGRLEQVLLGDTVSVYFPDMGIEASARVVEVEYDCILERYKSVTLGSVKANLATTIAAQNKEIAKKPSLSLTERITTALAKAMTGALGGCVRLLDTDDDGMPDELYIGDNADPAKAKKVWRFNYEGWAVSKTGYNGPFIMGATVDDGILAWMVTAANLVAGTIMSADNGETFLLDLDNGILKMNATEIRVDGKTVDKISSDNAKDVVNAQTQTDIFNKLTNNGTIKGLYMQNNQLYINADYLKSGKISSIVIESIAPTGPGIRKVVVEDGNVRFYQDGLVVGSVFNGDFRMTVASYSGYDMHLTSEDGGKVYVDGRRMEFGTATINYSSASNWDKTITFGKSFSSKPMVLVSQVFNNDNIVVNNNDITTTGFTVRVPQMSSTGSREFNWIAIGT